MLTQTQIQSCIKREQKALKHCYESCAPYLYTIVKSYIYDEESRKDVLQEVFAAIFSSLGSFDSTKGKFKPWIAKITVNQSIKYLRNQRKLNLFVPLDQDAFTGIESEDKILNQFSRQDMLKHLQKMPEGYRTIFVMSIIDEYSHKEIAKQLDISVGTSRSQLSRAINWIKKHLTKEINLTYHG